MKQAILLAEKGAGRTNPNPVVGAVIVKNHRIIGTGFHEKYGEAHAEVNAIRDAGERVSGAVLYVNLEPCSHHGKTPPCADLIIEKGIRKVVVGILDPNPLVSGQGVQKLRNAGVEVVTGVLEAECSRINEVFLQYITTGHPFVLMKTAMSLDGKTALETGESKWITGEAARRDVQELRNRFFAIMAGIGTVRMDDPELTCRKAGGRNPVRIIVDSRLSISLESKVLQNQEDNQTILAAAEHASEEKRKQLEDMGARVIISSGRDGGVDLQDLMTRLGAERIDSVLLEGGATLNDSALAQGIVQKFIAYVAPKLIGGAASKTPVGGKGIAALHQAYSLKPDGAEWIGDDLKITAYLKKEGV